MTGRRRSAGRGRGLSVSESLPVVRPAPGLAASLSPNGVRDRQFSDAHSESPANRNEDGEYNFFFHFFKFAKIIVSYTMIVKGV